MVANFIAWVQPRLTDGTYVGWLFEQNGVVVSGAGMWLMDFPPHWMDARPLRAYLLNFFVEPSCRGQGIAQSMLKIALAEARQRGIRVIALHASELGRPIYERFGFRTTNEMFLSE